MNGSRPVHQEAWQPIALREAVWLSPFLLGYIAFGLYSARLGFAANPDSPAIWRSAGVVLEGGYQPSRTSGFPAYEGFVALLRGLGADVPTVAVATMAFGVAAFALALRSAPGPAARLAVAILFCASPVVVTNASSLMETNLALMTVAAFLCLHLRLSALPGDPGWRLAATVMLAGCAVVLSRIDAAIVVTASLCALFLVRRRPIYLALLAGTGIASFLTYWLVRGDLGFIGVFPDAHDPLGRSLVKAAVGAVALLWTAGGTATAVLALNRRRLAPELSAFLAIAAALYAVRFVILSDELEYLLPFYFVVIVLAGRTMSWPKLAWATPAAALGMLATPLLFEKPSDVADVYRIAPALGPPGIVLDLQRRAEMNVEQRNDYWQWLEHQTGTPLRRSPQNGYLRSLDGRVLVVFRDAAHIPVSPRWQHHRPLSAYDRVVLCASARRQPYGWRQLRRPFPATAVGEFNAGLPIRCESVAGPVGSDRYLQAARRLWPGA